MTPVTDMLSDTQEAQILRDTPKQVRRLYAALGEPTESEFPGVHNLTPNPQRTAPYTRLRTITAQEMRQEPVDYRIQRPSDTKTHIIDRYYADGWSIRVLAYNVMCSKYIRSTSYPHLAVRLTASRDKATYEYVYVQ